MAGHFMPGQKALLKHDFGKLVLKNRGYYRQGLATNIKL